MLERHDSILPKASDDSNLESKEDVEPSDDTNSDSGDDRVCKNTKQKGKRGGKKRVLSVENDSDDETIGVSVSCRKSRRTVSKVPWSADEETLLKAFSMHLKKGTVPGKKECLEVKANSGDILANRTWFHMKYSVKNAITTSMRQIRPK